LELIKLDENPLISPPIEVTKRGIESIRQYFKEIEREETTHLFEAKLLVVGQGKVGKTYLMNRLVYDKIDPKTISTEGIDINRWIVKTKKTDKFQINFWDFGGQEIYHATHQFFLTKRSLYLFVWEARTDADILSFEYWLNTIKVLSDNSPVIVIQNKIDERKKSLNQENWKRRFQNILEYHDVSAIKSTGINRLRERIIREIENLPHIGDILPKRWMNIRQHLEALKENFIPYSYYERICSEYKMNGEQTRRLSEYYHDLGVFLHFKNNPILQNTIFLKPEWATNAVYKVLDNPQVIGNYGIFRYKELGNIWKDRNEFPANIHIELVELMKSFELCFELPYGQEYIIPELLRANPPKTNWNYGDNLQFKYVYDFMPAGIITRFIVIAHDLIKENLYWKDGMVIARENAAALIVKTDNGTIQIWIHGVEKKALLGIIRRHMDYIHSPYSNLKVSEMVPCLCEECRGDPEPYFHPYQNLLKARLKRRKELQCQKSLDSISTKKLLGGIEDKTPPVRDTRKQNIKLFLASSNELNEERQEIELFLSRENRRLYYQNIFLNLIIWEDLKHSFSGDRIQDYFNREMLKCDIVICMFFKKIGNFTKEEFDKAYNHFKKGKKPRHIYVFFKSGEVDIDEIDEDILKIRKLKEEIKEAEQIYKSFKSNDDLVIQLKKQLDLIIPEIVY